MKTFSLIDKAFFLKKTHLFEDLELDLLLAISEKLTSHSLEPGEALFEAGQKGSHLFIIVNGKIELLYKNQSIILEEKETFGEESLFNTRKREYGAKAKTQSLVFSLSKSHLLTIFSECPSVVINLLEAFCESCGTRYFVEPAPKGAEVETL